MPLSIASTLKRAAGPLLKVPTADGAAGEALLTDGDGNLSFGNPVPAAHNHDGSYQPLDAELSAIAGLSSAADRLPYFTGSGTAALADLSTAGRALIDDADAAAQRSTLGLGTAATQNAGAFEAAGTAATAVSAHEAAGDPHPQYLTASEGSAAYQPLDAELTALAGLTSGANKLPYFSGSGAAALTDLSAAGRALIDDADAAAQRTTLGLGTAAVEAASAFQPADAQLTDLSALSYSGNALKALRVNAAATGLEFASIGGGSTELDIHAQSSTYAQQASDLGDLIDFDTAGQTLNLLAAATAGDKYFCWVRYRGADTGVLTVDGN
ncbi:MAG: hypothetical protein JNG89_05795, partial [Planctomycetaceae bacterium]|nr:hypothetical protein [Planctomycetaceae bacterium]